MRVGVKRGVLVAAALVAGVLVAVLPAGSGADSGLTLTLTNVMVSGPPSQYAPTWIYNTPNPGGDATYQTDTYVGTYSFPVPSTIPAAGVSFTIKVTAYVRQTAPFNTSFAPAMGVSSPMIQNNSNGSVSAGTDACGMCSPGYQTPNPNSGSAEVKLAPTGGGPYFLRVGLQDGPTFTYEYEVQTPTTTSTTTTTELPPTTFRPPPCNGAAADEQPLAHAAALNEVRVVKVCPDVQFHKGGTPADAWLPLEKNTVLKQGDEITCDPDGVAVLAFADNSTVTVWDTTQLKIASFFTEGGVVRTEILLTMGRIAATVNKSEATKSDFRIKSPTDVSSVRGTIFSVFYDPGSRVTLTSTSRGSVLVTPSNRSVRPVTVRVGREVQVTKSSASLAPIGRAGARGGVDIAVASQEVEALIGGHRIACGTTTPRSGAFSVGPALGGWAVSVNLIGRLHGTSKWKVNGRRVTATNPLATELLRGCG